MLVLAHRGYHRDHPENTLPAFSAAVDLKVDGIETDIRETSDGALVLFHDAHSPHDTPVLRTTKNELEQAVGYAIPTLDEALLAHPDILWNLEVKAPGKAAKVARALKPYRDYQLLVTSFDHELVMDLLPQIDAIFGLLFDKRHDDLERYLRRRMSERLKTIVVEYAILDEDTLDASRELDVDVFCYGVVSAADHARCHALDLAGVITDYPERMGLTLHEST